MLHPNCQAFAHESSKVEGREKERKGGRKDRGQEADGKKGSPTKQKHSEELKQGPPRHSQVQMIGWPES